MIVSTQKLHPISFSRFLNPFLLLFYTDIETMVLRKDIIVVEPMFVIPQMMFMANVLSCSHYIPDEVANESIVTWRSERTSTTTTTTTNTTATNHTTRRAITTQGDVTIDPLSVRDAIQNVGSFFTIERIQRLVDASIYFMSFYNESHLAAWSDDPEMFFFERMHAVAEDDIISCAQNLYLSLLESSAECKAIVVEKIISLVHRVDDQIQAAIFEARIQTRQNLPYIAFWDAVYTTIGLSLHTLQSFHIDINNWFQSTIAQSIRILLEPQQSMVRWYKF